MAVTEKYSIIFEGNLKTDKLDRQITAYSQKKVSIMEKGGVKTITETSKGLNKLGQEVTNTTVRTEGLKSGVKGLASGFGSVIGKVAKFGAATAVIGGFTAAITDAFAEVKQLDDSVTQFKKVSNLEGTGLKEYTQELGKAGAEVARTTSEMVDAATEFKKSGYSDEDAKTLATTASMYQNVADSEMDAGTAADFIISQMIAFNIKAKDSQKIIDSVNEVSNDYAVSSTDLSLALSKTSSAMGALGNSFDETLGLVTAGAEVMQNQSGKVSRG
jgi:uncharacterized protein YoxC